MQKLSARLGVHDVPPALTPQTSRHLSADHIPFGKFTATRAFSFAFTVFALSFISPSACFFRILFICPRFMSHAGRQACRNIFARTHTHTPVGHTHYPWVCVYYMRYEYVCVHYDVGGGWNFLQHRKCSTTLVWHMNYILIIQPASVGFRIRNLHCKGTPEI